VQIGSQASKGAIGGVKSSPLSGIGTERFNRDAFSLINAEWTLHSEKPICEKIINCALVT